MISRIINGLGRRLPNSLSRKLSLISPRYRFGNAYSEFEKNIKSSEKWNESDRENYIIHHFNKIFQHAKNFEMYKVKYQKEGVLDLEIKSLEDIEKVPILNKEEIRANIDKFSGYFKQNTGGTSGNPLPLYLDKNVWGREWAHYHNIWKKTGYETNHAKFFFRGVNLGSDFIKYDFEHNNYVVNLYLDPIDYIQEFMSIFESRNIKYFQGYPSAIFDFLRKIENNITPEQKALIKNKVKLCFLNSEYPTPQIVSYLKNTWHLDFVSCYGHSEVCVLAWTHKNSLEYYPMYTYSYTEVVNNMLLGTSYHNYDMPLVRYNTGDLVRESRYSNGVVKYFEVKEGRIGDFIFDKNNNKVSLTALFFGRHHEIYNYIDYIQVSQKEIGKAIIFITQYNKQEGIDVNKLIDFSGVEIDFEYTFLSEPIRTKAGKVPLKVIDFKNA